MLLTYQICTKPGLKTYIIFDTIRSVLLRVLNAWWYTEKERQGQESLTKIVNALTCQVGDCGPMASLYLLGILIITLTEFVVILWKSYVTEFEKLGNKMVMYNQTRLFFENVDGEFIGLSTVDDYIQAYEFEWQVLVWMDSDLYKDWSVLIRAEKISESKTWCEATSCLSVWWRRWYRFWKWFRLCRIWSSIRERENSGKYPFLQIIHFMKLIKSVFLNPKIWCPILQGDHCLDVTRVVESITVLQCNTVQHMETW